jgi:hypothetical protein
VKGVVEGLKGVQRTRLGEPVLRYKIGQNVSVAGPVVTLEKLRLKTHSPTGLNQLPKSGLWKKKALEGHHRLKGLPSSSIGRHTHDTQRKERIHDGQKAS